MSNGLRLSGCSIGVFPLLVALSWAAEPPMLKAVAANKSTGRIIVAKKDLQSLDQILQQRMAQHGQPFQVLYKAIFTNNFYYETQRLDTLLAEENGAARRIVAVSVQARLAPALKYEGPLTADQQRTLEEAILRINNTDTPRVEIQLDDSGVSWSILGADRDWVLATERDLADQLRTLVSLREPMDYSVRGLPAGLAFLGVVFFFATRFKRRHDAKGSGPTMSLLRSSIIPIPIFDPWTSGSYFKGLRCWHLLCGPYSGPLSLGSIRARCS